MEVANNQAHLLSSIDTRILRETKNAEYKVEYGKILDFKPEKDEFIVENQETGDVEKWDKQESIGVIPYAEKKEKQLTVASLVISYLSGLSNALKETVVVLISQNEILTKRNARLEVENMMLQQKLDGKGNKKSRKLDLAV